MANTVIQLRRSTATAQPASLSAAEPAYSYLSDKMFIGTSDGAQVIEIGGRFYVNTAVRADQTANAAFLAANAAPGIANSYASAVGVAANSYASSVGVAANAYSSAVGVAANAYSSGVGVAANSYASAVGVAANSYAAAVGVAANAYSTSTFLPKTGGTISGDLTVQGNATFSGTVTYANTQTLLIGDNIMSLNADLPVGVAPSENAGLEINRGSSANVYLLWNEGTDKWTFTVDGTNYVNIASNTDVETAVASGSTANYIHANNVGIAANAYASSVGVAANSYASAVGVAANSYASSVGVAANAYTVTVGAAANAYTVTVGAASNTWANTVGTSANAYASAVGVAANNYAALVGAAANTNAANASYISTGTLAVSYGGTGKNTFTVNGILYGNGTSPLNVTAAGTEGQVLQASASGVPQFGMLDGGVF